MIEKYLTAKRRGAGVLLQLEELGNAEKHADRRAALEERAEHFARVALAALEEIAEAFDDAAALLKDRDAQLKALAAEAKKAKKK